MANNIGINLAQNDDWLSSRTWINLKNLFRKWGPADAPWNDAPIPLSPEGYPLKDAGSIAAFNHQRPGTYNYSFDGSGTITFNGLTQTKRRIASQEVGTVVLPESGNVYFSITGINPVNYPHNLKIVHSDYDINTAELFTPEFLDSLKPISTIRFMDWGRTNGSPLKQWPDRCLPISLQTTDLGVCEEYKIALCNKIQKDAWINVPHQADDDYIDNLAKLWGASLDPRLNVHVEFSNECWNFAFPQAKEISAQGIANPTLSRDQYEVVYQQVAARLKRAVEAFRKTMGSSRVRGILAGQAVNTWWTSNALAYMDKTFGAGTASGLIWGLAYAEYFSPWDGAAQGDLNAAFAVMNDRINTDSQKWSDDFRAQAALFKIANVVTYEAGVGMIGTDRVYQDMQYDPRIGQTYEKVVTKFFGNGNRLWMHYNHVSDWTTGQYGYWGAKKNHEDNCPKWNTLVRLAGGAVAPSPTPVPVPTPVPTPVPPPTPAPKVVEKVAVTTAGVKSVIYLADAGNVTVWFKDGTSKRLL